MALWTVKEVAVYLNVSQTHVWRLVSTGRLPGFKVGKCWRFDPDELKAYVRMQRTPDKYNKKLKLFNAVGRRSV